MNRWQKVARKLCAKYNLHEALNLLMAGKRRHRIFIYNRASNIWISTVFAIQSLRVCVREWKRRRQMRKHTNSTKSQRTMSDTRMKQNVRVVFYEWQQFQTNTVQLHQHDLFQSRSMWYKAKNCSNHALVQYKWFTKCRHSLEHCNFQMSYFSWFILCWRNWRLSSMVQVWRKMAVKR